MKADLILTNGDFLTMNTSKPHAEAVAIKDDKIVKVGRKEEIAEYFGENTAIIDLKGKTVIPGLIDAHIHVAYFGRILTWVNLNDAKSITEIKDKIKSYSKSMPKGKWIIGFGWNEENLAEKRPPNAKDLDEVASDNPVILFRQQGRVCVVNTKALKLAGITEKQKPPFDGEIERDPKTGELTGILCENATDLVWKIIPEPSKEEVLEAVKLAFQKILEAGITSIHWIVLSPSEIPIIRKLCAKNDLPLNICLIIPINLLDDIWSLKRETKKGRVKFGGVAVFVDGSLAARTAALSQPYKDCSTTRGRLLHTQEEMNELAAKIHKAGLQLVIHAMGDKAIDMTLKALKNALSEAPKNNSRHRIEQAALLNRNLIKRAKELGVIVSVQPHSIISEFLVWSALNRLGPKRARWLYPLKTLFKEGVVVVGGSDCPMEPLNPFLHIKATVARQFYPEQQISVSEALRMYTINAAYASFEENIKGSIEEGKVADLTVISHNPLEVPPDHVDCIRVEMTIVGGRIVYRRD